jgi:hypothetical protein
MAQNLDVLSPSQSINAEGHGMILDPSISPDTVSVGSLANSEAHSSTLTASHTLELDVDMDRYAKMEMEESAVTEVLPSPALSTYSDVSNFLDYQNQPEDMFGVLSNAQNPSFLHMAPCDDMYGWNAEWSRRLSTPQPPPSLPSQQLSRQSLLQRRGRRTKGNLLGRVFGVGRTPSRIRPSP